MLSVKYLFINDLTESSLWCCSVSLARSLGNKDLSGNIWRELLFAGAGAEAAPRNNFFSVGNENVVREN